MKQGWETDSYGDKYHYKDNELHSINDEPAAILNTGTKFWYQNGKYHRINGPAVIWPNGEKQYWIDNKRLSKEKFDKQSQEAEAEEAPTNKNYPHTCPNCKSPAYISFLNQVDCSNCKGS